MCVCELCGARGKRQLYATLKTLNFSRRPSPDRGGSGCRIGHLSRSRSVVAGDNPRRATSDRHAAGVCASADRAVFDRDRARPALLADRGPTDLGHGAVDDRDSPP